MNTKKLLSIVLSLSMIFTMLPVGAFAGDGGGSLTPRTSTLDLTGTSYQTGLTPSEGVWTNAAEGWSWDDGTNTLTLSGVTIQGDDTTNANSCGINLPDDSKIVLTEGTTNRVTAGTASGTVGWMTALSFGIAGSGTLTISGPGTLEVAGQSVGIYCDLAKLTIQDSTVNATGDDYGIGTGSFDIISGTVTATGNFGIFASASSYIRGGKVTATGGTDAGIDVANTGSVLEISGGKGTASSTNKAFSLNPTLSNNVTLTGAYTEKSISWSVPFTVTGNTDNYEYSNHVLTIKGDVTVANTDPNAPTTDRIEVTTAANITLDGVNIDVGTTDSVAAFQITSTAGAVNITLADGSTNTLTSGENCAGLQKEGTALLTIKGDTNGTGILNATGGGSAAGIGGGAIGTGSYITIEGGTVTAKGGSGGAGIGGGNGGTGRYITISGGTVNATGGSGGAGIGGGDSAKNGTDITISGGTVTATGSNGGAGIGGGSMGAGTNITISGGSVKASSIGCTPTNGQSAPANVELYTLTVTTDGTTAVADTAITALTVADCDYYGIKDVKTDSSGKLYVYLPTGKTTASVTADSKTYSGDVASNAATLIPSLPTATAYAVGAAAGTDYVVDTPNTTLTINTAKGAAYFSANGNTYLGYKVLLANDIDVGTFSWMPVGKNTAPFAGTFDGQNYELKNLTVTTLNDDKAGMFGHANINAVVKNLTVSGSINISSDTPVPTYIGGIVGYSVGTVQNCKYTGTITTTGAASFMVGGIVGNGTATNCYNTGSISAAGDPVGGIVGTGTATNCYNTGNVSSSKNFAYIGGIVGDGRATNCYNTGTVSGTGSTPAVGAIVGSTTSGSTTTHCYWLAGSAAKAVGKNSGATITGCGTFTDNTGALTAGDATNCGSVQALAAYATDLLAALNGWVNATANADYCLWAADTASANGGYPVLTANRYGTRTTTLDLTGESYKEGLTPEGTLWTNAAEGWSWDTADNTLTLSGVTIQAPDTNNANSIGIKLPGGSKIVLTADKTNQVTGGTVSGGGPISSIGVLCSSGTLTISGSGTLVAESTGLGYGLSCNELTIETGTISATGVTYGIATNRFTIQSGTVTATGEKGLSAAQNSSIQGGTVTATGSAGAGIYVGNSNRVLEISGGEVTATGSGTSYGIEMYSGGTVKLTGGKGTASSTNKAFSVNPELSNGVTLTGAYDATSASWSVLPTASAYLTANPAEAGTDYVEDDTVTPKTLVIKTAKGAAYFSANGNTYLGYKVLLANTINVSAFSWTPVGNGTNAFTGTFDGQNYELQNLTVTTLNDRRAGVFGQVGKKPNPKNATVKNLTVTGSVNVSDSSDCYVGSIVGYNLGIIDHCTNKAAITLDTDERSPQSNTGGIVGSNLGTIRNCNNTGAITATSNFIANAGGIVGTSSGGSIQNCFNTGAASASGGSSRNYSGGIAGEAYNSCTIANCYSTGTVSASGGTNSNAGGISGLGGTIKHCYYKNDSASVISTEAQDYPFTATNCGTFADSTGALTAGTLANCGSVQTLAGYATNLLNALNGWVTNTASTDYSTWAADSTQNPTNGGYPVFGVAFAPLPTATEYAADAEAGKDYVVDTTATPKTLTLKTAKGAAHFSANDNNKYLDYKVILNNTIDVSAFIWKPVGDSSNYFTGTFDGQNHELQNLTVTTLNDRRAGVFGQVGDSSHKTATVKNLTVTGSVNVSDSSDCYVGGIVGYNLGIIDHCTNKATITSAANKTGSPSVTGGIVGFNDNGTIRNCTNTGTITATSSTAVNAGGIVGASSIGSVQNCWNTGAVSASGGSSQNYSGGIAGRGYGNAAIANCYSTGAVSASGTDNKTGGICGSSDIGDVGITNCYYLSTASATNILGSTQATGITGCGTIGVDQSALTAGTATNCGSVQTLATYATNLLAALNGWVTATASTNYSTWAADSTSPTNGGYPVFGVAWAAPHSHCICGGDTNMGDHTDHTTTKPTYTPFTGTGGALSAGSYYLTADVTLTGGITIASGQTVNLCLNGHKLDANDGNFSVIQNSGTLNICDCNATKTYYGQWNSGKTIYTVSSVRPSGSYDTLTGGVITGAKKTTASSSNGDGGGIYNLGTLTLYGGNIAGNQVGVNDDANASGGGVHNSGSFTMYAGSIAGNSAGASGGRGGGGVDNSGGLSFTMLGGRITGNAALGLGGGVMGGTLTVGGTAKITGNSRVEDPNNVSLSSGKTITVSTTTPLATGADIGIRTVPSPTVAVPVAITGSNSADYSKYFFADDSTYTVKNAGTGTEQVVQLTLLPTAEKYLEANPAVEGTDYVVDDTANPKTLVIKTAKGAAHFSTNGNKYRAYHVTLAGTIDVGAFSWTPVGNSSKPFTGTFDGGNHALKNLTVTTLNDNYAGVLGYTASGAVVKNLTVSGSVTVRSNSECFAGGIVGYSKGTMSHCSSSAEVSVTTTGVSATAHAGGIVGYREGGTIRNCNNTGVITAVSAFKAHAGGIVGTSSGGSVQNCFNTGAAFSGGGSNSNYSGGIVGQGNSGATIANCYSTGSVSASGTTNKAGAICGAGGTIQNCYFKSGGNPIGNSNSVSGIVFSATACGTFADNSGALTPGDAANCGSVQTPAAYATDLLAALNGWVTAKDSTDYYTWVADSVTPANGGYPVFGSPLLPTAAKYAAGAVEGTDYVEDDTATPKTLVIKTAKGAAHFSANGNKYCAYHVTLANTIDVGAFSWMPVGGRSTQFTGVFDGQNHELQNLTITATNDGYVGVFGTVGTPSKRNATVKNLTVSGNINISSGSTSQAGSIAGYNYGTIDHCTNKAAITLTTLSSATGGIVGKDSQGTIKNCTNTGAITATDANAAYAGGIVGISNGGNVQNCFNTGAVSASGGSTSNYSGGIVGQGVKNHDTSLTIANCYSAGAVSASGTGAKMGGICGMKDSSSVAIANCYYLSTAAASILGTTQATDITACGTFTADGTLTQGTIANCGADQTLAAYATNLLNALNGWVTAAPGTDYFTWAADSANANGGYPVLGTAVTGVTLDKATLSLYSNSTPGTGTLTATIAPADATNQAVTWSSNNTAVATVADGVVTAVGNGTAIITVTTTDGGFTDTCTVTVSTYTSSSDDDDDYTPVKKPTEPVTGNTESKAIVDDQGNASVTLTDKTLADALADAKAKAAKKGVNAGEITAVIHVIMEGKMANTVTVNLPKTTQEQVIGNKIAKVELVIDRPDITISIDLAAVIELHRQAQADVQLSATRLDNDTLTGEAETAIGDRPAYDLKATFQDGSKLVSEFGTGVITVEIPYTLQEGEVAGNVCAVYVDAAGQLTYLTEFRYDATRALVILYTGHLSTYAVAYKQNPGFTDIGGHWAEEDILFVANRGLMNGTGGTTFSPNGSMTRGMFVTALARLARADVSGYTQSSFTDVTADSYCMGSIEWGVKNNILLGIGAGKFAPDDLVTREQMAVIMDRYAAATGFQLPQTDSQSTFADHSAIGWWAAPSVRRIQMAGILRGTGDNCYNPQSTATRAEAAAVLHRFVELVEASQR